MKQKLLLTGGSGFLGKNTISALKKQDVYTVKAPSRKDCDLTQLTQAISACKNMDVVVHAAGLVLSRAEQKRRPGEVFFQNVSATLNILEAARLAKVKKLLFVSSITAYGEQKNPRLKELDLWSGPPLEANFSYGISKRIMDTASRSFSAEYKIKTCCIILSNLYGPADKFSFNPPPLVANAISQIAKAKSQNQKVFLAGNNGAQGIDLLYIDDASEAIKKLLALPIMPALLNVGAGRSVKISEVFRLIAKALNYKGKIVWQKAPKNSAAARYLDMSLMKKELKWTPKTSLEKGIQASVNWYLHQQKIKGAE